MDESINVLWRALQTSECGLLACSDKADESLSYAGETISSLKRNVLPQRPDVPHGMPNLTQRREPTLRLIVQTEEGNRSLR